MMKTTDLIERHIFVLAATALTALLFAGCGPNEKILQSANETPTTSNSTPALSSLDEDIETMRTAKFSHIYVIKRKDAQKLDSEDMSLIRLYSANMNRRVMSDEDRAVVIGTNTPIPAKELLALYDKFAVDSYMRKPEADTNTNSNSTEP